ncbi:integrase catalytic domain-containing protein [Trichonephila clavipes]|nr:integrase catalytic domain-containing protein [Trichonephila clavipes]
MKNAASGRTKMDLPALYDELEGKLLSLKNLGRTQEKYGDFLTLLVESCLPKEILEENETKPKHHSVFSIEVSDLKRSYASSFEALSEKKICGFISKIEDKHILNELKNKEIILSDSNCKETEIGLLIGADNIGKLLTGNLIDLDSGLTAVETKLEWTLIGKLRSNLKNAMLTTSSLHVRNVKELWELNVLGMTDP